MLPLYLQLKDFKLHKESTIDFTKLSHASLIVGMEDDNLSHSIGVGKTTIFEAVQYAIYNAKPFSNINKIIRDGAKKVEVIFDFQMSDGSIYRIERSRTKSTQNVYLRVKTDNEWKDLTDRTNTLTDEKILSIVKINQDTFGNSSYFKQNDQFNLASATASKRKEIIREMLHLDEWSLYEKKAKAIRDDYNNKLSTTNKIIENLGSPQIDIDNLSTELTNINNLLESKNSIIEQNSKEIDTKKLELEELKRNLDSEYPQLLKKLNNEQNYLSQLNSSLSNLLSDKLKNEKAINTLQVSQQTIQSEIHKKESYIEELKNSIPEEPSNEEYQNVCDKLSKLTVVLKENENLYKTISKPIPSDNFCPTCSTELDENHRAKLCKLKQERMEQVLSEIKTDKEEFLLLTNQKKDFENKIRNYKDINYNISSMISELGYKKKSFSSNEEILSQKINMLKSLEDEIQLKQKNIEQTKNSIESLSELVKSAETNFNDKIIDKTNQEIRILLSKEKSLREEYNSLILKKGKIQNSIESKQNDIQKLSSLQSQKQELEYNLNVYKAASVVFGASGIPAMIIHSVLDNLQLETNKVLEMLIPGIQVNFFIEKQKSDGTNDETLGMKFFKDGKEHEFAALSGGQQEGVALALKFAICVINRNRCGADINLLLLDEVDKSLDESTIDCFYNVLKTWNTNIKILVITHNRQLKEKFKSFILVNKTGDYSTAEVVN